MQEAFIYDGGRSAFGRYGGSLSSVRPDDLLAHVIKTLSQRLPFAAGDYEDVIAGNTNQAGEDSRNIARHAGLLAGLSEQTGGLTINRLCGSGLAAALDASRCIKAGEGELFVAGGVESMSRAPLVLSKSTSPFDRSQTLADSTIGARFGNPLIHSQFGSHTMPQTADNIAFDLQISRDDSDRFAEASQSKYQAALQQGFYADEILPLEVSVGRKQTATIAADEHPRADSNYDALQKLKPLFEGGVVTAGNASGINDGAAALVIGSREAGEKAGLAPRARIICGAIAGVAPRVMGLGPVPASQKALSRAGLRLADMDVLEFNEAFAVQVLGCLQMLKIDFRDERVNPNGGAIAIGHPLGASGARILLTAMRRLEQMGGRHALVSMCIGVGQGIAAVIERQTGNGN